MKGIFVNENGGVKYALALVTGYKTIETRSRDMLSALVGERVAVIKTRRNKKPEIIGYITITGKSFCAKEDFDKFFINHLVFPESAYAPKGAGKWFYYVGNPERCEPFPLPENAVRHGRSWCEF